jgi:hypothetical protein
VRFDCGEEWAEKRKRLENWHPFYAIWPRRVAPHDCRWFEMIERRGMYGPHYAEWFWSYRGRPEGGNG